MLAPRAGLISAQPLNQSGLVHTDTRGSPPNSSLPGVRRSRLYRYERKERVRQSLFSRNTVSFLKNGMHLHLYRTYKYVMQQAYRVPLKGTVCCSLASLLFGTRLTRLEGYPRAFKREANTAEALSALLSALLGPFSGPSRALLSALLSKFIASRGLCAAACMT